MAGTTREAGRQRILAGMLVVGSTLLTCLALEAGLRINRGGRFAPASPVEGVQMVGGGYPAVWDATLGYAPTPGASGRDNVWRKRVTIDSMGLRSNGASPLPGPAILVLGDSFVFGDEVDDRDTWPAALERRVGRPVRNGGVFGYGLDQIVLRAEDLLGRIDVDTLVVSIIPDDVSRCEYAYRFAHKPWFDLDDGALALHNTPTPRPEAPAPGSSVAWRLLLRSALLEFVANRLDLLGRPLRGGVRVHREGIPVSTALIERLAERTRAGGHALFLVAAWHPGADTALLDPARRRAIELGVPVVDLEPVLTREIEAAGGDWSGLFHAVTQGGRTKPGHMTPRGNTRVAEAIASRLTPR